MNEIPRTKSHLELVLCFFSLSLLSVYTDIVYKDQKPILEYLALFCDFGLQTGDS